MLPFSLKMEREKGLDFARAFAAIGIVVFHFYCHSSSAHKLFLLHANGGWGTAINYLFFALSGYLLHKKYGKQERFCLTTFYYKRWKATMPAYIAVFLFAYFQNVASAGTLFYLNIPKWRLLLSFIGMDGYVSWVTPTYFITGEWFLGAILVAYATYPLLRYLANHRWLRFFGLAVLLAFYGIFLKVSFFGLPTDTTPAVCLLSFFLGMLGAEQQDFLKKKFVVAISALLCVVCFAVPFPANPTTPLLLGGCGSLIVLNSLGNLLCRNKWIDRATREISGLTYPIFLIHHRIIFSILDGFDTVSTLHSLGVLLLALMVCLVFAKTLDVLMKSFFKSSIYLKFERLFQGEKE